MLEVSKYIQDLLYLHDCVILPGFGGFVANYKAARIDENLKLILPPSKDLGFNRNLTQNDGLLINHLAESESLSYSEAEKSVSFFVEDMRVKIQRGEKFVLENIGTFFNDRKYNLQFEPAQNLNYLVDSFGLEHFELPELAKSSKEQIPLIVKDSKTIKSKFFDKKFWYVSAAAAACLTALAIIPMNSERSGFLNSASLNLFDSNENAIAEKHVQLKAQISPPEELVRFEPKLTKNVTVKVEKAKKNKFYLIAGSFTTIENAKILQSELRAKSYPALIIKNKNLFSVAVNQFDNRKAVDGFKKKVLAANPKSSYWVLKK